MSAGDWRKRGLWGALATTVVWTAVAGKGSGGTDKPSPAPRPALPAASRAAPEPVLRVALEALPRDEAPAEAEAVTVHSFVPKSWRPPPPPPPPPAPAVKPPPPPPPSAPPVPFTFLGRYEEGGTRILMLVRGDRMYTVSEGDVIEQTYKVGPLAGGQLELTYLPMGVRQTLSTGGS